jgi:hypothetical protein
MQVGVLMLACSGYPTVKVNHLGHGTIPWMQLILPALRTQPALTNHRSCSRLATLKRVLFEAVCSAVGWVWQGNSR